MIEIIAAIIGATLGGAGTSLAVASGRARENREIVIRLTVGMENVAARLEQLHLDIKADRTELFGRLANLEMRLAKVEARLDP